MTVPPAALPPDHFALLQRVIRTVARVHHLNPDDAEEFSQTVHLKLLERGYDVFERYEGRSSLATFLSVVVTRLLLDWRNASRGKWRPSARAMRLGPDAVALERLVHRDGFTRQEAIATVAGRRGREWPDGDKQLQALADALPARSRRVFVRDIGEDAMGCLDFSDPVVAAEARGRRRVIGQALRQAYTALDADERRLLALRYGRAYSVRAIGDALATDPKPLYRKLDRVLRTLRRQLASFAVDPVDAERTA